MSTIGPSNPAQLNLAGSFAGAQRTNAQQDETKAAKAQQRFQVDQSNAADKDVEEPDLDADRDADGRQSWAEAGHPDAAHEAPHDDGSSAGDDAPRHAPDAFGLRGGNLDVDA